jgi:hypothetical protein
VKARCHGPSYTEEVERALAGCIVIAQMAATMAVFAFVMAQILSTFMDASFPHGITYSRSSFVGFMVLHLHHPT